MLSSDPPFSDAVRDVACKRMLERAHGNGSSVTWDIHPGATHDFDDPGTRRQALAANRAAREDALHLAVDFITNPPY